MHTSYVLVQKDIDLAKKIARLRKKNLPRYIDIEELQSAAYLGLVEAASRYIPGQGAEFSTFAYPRIWGAVNDYLRKFGNSFISLDSSDDDEGSLMDNIQSPKTPANQEEILEVVSNDLGEQAKEIIRLYFYEDKQMKDVGKHLGFTESRVSQLLTTYKKNIRERYTYQELSEELAA